MERISTDEQEPEGKVFFSLKALLLVLIAGLLGIAILLGAVLTYLNTPPANSAYPLSFTVESGESLREIAADLKTKNAIRSEEYLYFLLVTFFDPTAIKASTYVIEEPLTTFAVANKLVQGDFDNDLVRFTHIEGDSVAKLAVNAVSQLPHLSEDDVFQAAIRYEGKLFPDTYFVRADFTAEELIETLNEAFLAKIQPYEAELATSELTLDEVLILASIIEREANTAESMGLVASVFHNRLEIGMPLQADASIEYILDKPLSELTAADLEIDSPYNTYTNPGLPPTPIGSPGIVAIEAVLKPTPSNYFYYITDDTGTFHFAETYTQHLNNVNRYLR